MPDNYLLNVLNILRLLKASGRMGNQTYETLLIWVGGEKLTSAALKMAAYMHEQCEGAIIILQQSNLTTEAKEGLTQTVVQLASAFSMSNLNSAPNSFLPQIEAAISQFAIIVSITGKDLRASENVELVQLLSEVEAVRERFNQIGVDPLVADIANKNLHVLATMLRNVDALGLDSALSCYYEMIIRLKRADDGASPASKSKSSELWDKIKSWQERFTSIDQAVNTGSSLLQHGESLFKLIGGN